jgi:ABC-type bacteriocin/lantibiotic exporter with double-glycine peptidase domain
MDTSQAYSAVKSPFAKLWLLLKPHKKDLVSIYILAFFNGLIMLSIPLGIQTITNFLMTGQVSTSWVVMVIVVLIGVGLAYYIQVFQIKFVESLRQKIFLFSVFEIGSLMPKWKMESIDGRYAPEMVNRFFDILNIQGKLAKILIDFSLALFQVVFGLLLLTLYNGQFAFITLLSIVYFGVLLRATFKKGLITSKEESEHKYATAAWIEEGARSLETVKLASGNHMFLQKINDITTQYLQARTSHFSVLLRQYNGLIWYKILVIAILLILGGLLVINQQINIGKVFGIAQDWAIFPSDIPGKSNINGFPMFANGQHHPSRAKYVASIVEGCRNVIGNVELAAVGDAGKLLNQLKRVVHGVEWPNGGAFFLPQEGGIRFLDMRRIGKHD